MNSTGKEPTENTKLTKKETLQYHILEKLKSIFRAGKGWYSSLDKEFRLNTDPLQSTVEHMEKTFPLISYSRRREFDIVDSINQVQEILFRR